METEQEYIDKWVNPKTRVKFDYDSCLNDLCTLINKNLPSGYLTGGDAEKFLIDVKANENRVIPKEELDRMEANYKTFKNILDKSSGMQESNINIEDVINILNNYWTFDNMQNHTHSWHNKQYFIEFIRKEYNSNKKMEYCSCCNSHLQSEIGGNTCIECNKPIQYMP